MGRKGCAAAMTLLYSLVMHILLCFSVLDFAGWFSHYKKCFGGPRVCLWSYRFCGGAVLWYCWCLRSVRCG